MRVLTTPDLGNMVPLEGHPQLGCMLSRKSGQGHGQVKPHTNSSTPVIFEVVHQSIGLVTALALQDLQVLQDRRINRTVSE